MPAEKGLGLNNEERLFPTADSSCKDEQKYAIGTGAGCTLHLTTKHDQLLTEQRIFGDRFSLGASEDGERSS